MIYVRVSVMGKVRVWVGDRVRVSVTIWIRVRVRIRVMS